MAHKTKDFCGLDAATLLCFSAAMFLRWLVSSFPYSGYGKRPMHGDYEAQRHWQEITVNLPVTDWYRQTSDNDLLYWGLDYPPLTAYHSYICGFIGGLIDSSWVKLFSSRGIETYNHKLFMRTTVLVSDLLILLPAVYLYAREIKLKTINQKNTHNQNVMTVLSLLAYPGLILIDYGHFQYNGVSLGLLILAVTYMERDQLLYSSIFYCMSLNYKQMELYHAIPFFVYILSHCINNKLPLSERLIKLIKVSITVIITFIVIWAPFLTSMENMMNVVHRLFPFNRGLFEDKVSNFWCSLNVIIKIKNILSQPTILTLCTVSTLLSCVPSALRLFTKPTPTRFKYSLVISSLAFFLFSYQVHEKTILIPAVSLLLLHNEEPVCSYWFSIISTFSMLPLFIKDGLLLPYMCTNIIYTLIMINIGQIKLNGINSTLFMGISIGGVVCLSILSVSVPPPHRFPDIWAVLISLYSCAHLCIFYLYLHVKMFQFEEPSSKEDKSKKVK